MQQDFFYEIIKYKPLLFSKLLQAFNQAYTQSLQSFQCQGLPQDCTFLLNHIDIKKYLFKNSQNNESISSEKNSDIIDFSWNYAKNEKRLALLKKEELEKLSLLMGICLHAKEIAHIVTRDELLALKQEIGQENYVFALERGQYRLHKLAEVFAPFDAHLPLTERIKIHGQACLLTVASHWSSREKEKLPALETQSAHSLSPKQQEAVFFALKKILITEITSEWQQCLD